MLLFKLVNGDNTIDCSTSFSSAFMMRDEGSNAIGKATSPYQSNCCVTVKLLLVRFFFYECSNHTFLAFFFSKYYEVLASCEFFIYMDGLLL